MRKLQVNKYEVWDALMILGVIVAAIGILAAIITVIYTLGKDWF